MSSVTLMMDADRGDYRPRLVTYQGANKRTLYFAFKNADGTAKDLTGYTLSLTARLGGSNGYVKFGGADLTVVEASEGTAYIVPSAAQVAEAGELDAQVMFDGTASKYDYSEQFTLVVRPVIDIRIYPNDGDGLPYEEP